MSRRDTYALLHQFSADLDAARVKFRDFVRRGIGQPLLVEAGPNRSIAGGAEFVWRAATHLAMPVPEEVSRPDRVFRSLDDFQRRGPTRNDAIRAAYACGAFTMKAIADHFGLHYATVSRIVHGRSGRLETMSEYKT
jgi:hypothetical protein